MRTTRRVIQIIAFVLFLMLVALAPVIIDSADFFLRLSPLSFIATFASSDETRSELATGLFAAALAHVVRFLPAIIVLAGTIILGRWFCSWVCPLGTTLDASDRLCASARKGRASNLYDSRRLKLYLLVVVLLAALLGAQLTGWLDPLSIAQRSYVLVVHSYCANLADGLFGSLHRIPLVHHLTDPIHSGVRAALDSQQPRIYLGHWAFAFMLLAVLLPGLVLRRYWCRNLCPLGALLAITSGWGIFKRRVSDACTQCGRCARSCPMGAISKDGQKTLTGECTQCMTCRAICPTHAITFGRKQPAEQAEPVDVTRRGLIVSAAAGIAAVPLVGMNITRSLGAGNGEPTVIRPPGAKPEEEFLSRCVRCGACMRVCKTNGLHPTWFETGLEGMWTPRLIPRIGYCDHNCTLCGQVCPSQAIRSLTLEEKHTIAIGKARIDRNGCIPWAGAARLREGPGSWEDCNCAVCEEACPIPTKAIRFNTVTATLNGSPVEIRRPVIEEDLCTGCGFCEKVCPVAGSAVRVIPVRDGVAKVPSAEADEAGSPFASLFPGTVGAWWLFDEPTVYPPDKLWQYIDGAAPLYQAYAFNWAATASYRSNEDDAEIRADVWQFAATDDACGVFLQDTSGLARIEGIGSLAASVETNCWVWKGNYVVMIHPGGWPATPDETVELARAVAEALPAQEAPIPKLLAALPEENRIRASEQYLHRKINFDTVYRIDEDVFGLDVFNVNVALSHYRTDAGGKYLFGIFEYPQAATRQASESRFEAFLRQNGRKQPGDTTADVYIDDKGDYFLLARSGKHLIVAFEAPAQSLDTIRKALSNLQPGPEE